MARFSPGDDPRIPPDWVFIDPRREKPREGALSPSQAARLRLNRIARSEPRSIAAVLEYWLQPRPHENN